jgi:hypothetical protein
MYSSFVVIFCMLFLLPLRGQNSMHYYNTDYENTTHYYKGNELWLNDTISYYKSVDEDWVPTKRLVVLSRDGLGQELETAIEFYNEEDQSWQSKIKHLKSFYYFNGAQFLKESKTFIWNDYLGKWNTTSLSTYDTQGRILESFNLDWQPEHLEPLDGSKSVFTYGDDGKLIISENFVWNNDKQDWSKADRKSIVINAKTNVRNEEREIWDVELSKWVLVNAKNTKTDAAGNLLEEKLTVFDKEGEKTVLQNETKITYDDRGNILEIIKIKDLGYRKSGVRELNLITTSSRLFKTTSFSLDPVSGIWQPMQETRYAYDQEDNPVTILKRVWDKTEGQWINKSKEENQYSANMLYFHCSKQWDAENLVWVNDESVEYEYYHDQLASSLHRIWDRKNHGWTDHGRKLYEVSEHGNTFEVYQKWMPEHDDWLTTYESQWSYDNTGNIIGYEMQEFDKAGHSVFREKATFGWHMFALSKTENVDNYTIEVFPNPTKGVLHIKSIVGSLSRVSILDQAGHLVEAISLDQASTTIDVSYLPSGNYFLECITGIQTNTFKVVKL